MPCISKLEAASNCVPRMVPHTSCAERTRNTSSTLQKYIWTAELQECCQPRGHDSALVWAGTAWRRWAEQSTASDSRSMRPPHQRTQHPPAVSMHLTCWSLLPLSLGWCSLWSVPPTPPWSWRASAHEVAEPSGEANRPGPERETERRHEEMWNSTLLKEGVSSANTRWSKQPTQHQGNAVLQTLHLLTNLLYHPIRKHSLDPDKVTPQEKGSYFSGWTYQI